MTEPAAPPPASAPPPPPAIRRRRGLWIALVASLAVNLFLVGWVASSWVYDPRFGPGARAAAGTGMAFQHRRALHALSGSERQAAERIWRENFAELRDKLRALREVHANLRGAYAADNADAKSIGDAVMAVKDKANGVFDHVNATLLKIATALPPEARKAYFTAGFPRARQRRGAERRER
ncbi:MAG: periplasmic heavy metal sensor [Alphaproteobacteria bacterium]